MLKHLQSTLRKSVPLETLQEYSEVIAIFHFLILMPHTTSWPRFIYPPSAKLVHRFKLYVLIFSAFKNYLMEKTTLLSPSLYRLIIGLKPDQIPALPAFYDLSQHLMPTDEKATLRKKQVLYHIKNYVKKLKLPKKRLGQTERVAQLVQKENSNVAQPKRFLQLLFKLVNLDSSLA